MMAATHLKKVRTRPCSPLSIFPLLFITVCICLGTEETSCWSCGRGMLQILAAQRSWSSLSYFLFHDPPNVFTGERSGLQAGQFSTRTLLLQSHAVVTDAGCGLT